VTISAYLKNLWSATDFDDPELSGYAENHLRSDTRFGLQTMAGLALAMQLAVATMALAQNSTSTYVYTSALFALLCVHILVSAFFVKDVRGLHALGITFLTCGAFCITVLAHRSGELNVGMMASIMMLMISIPLVPWALRETTIVVGLTYVLITVSLTSVPGRFTGSSLQILQALIFGVAAVVLFVTAKNTFIRKHDIRVRFELEATNAAMELLSMKDHLTGAWNRRFLDENFAKLAEECADKGETLHIAVLDIDDFKGINDTYGHQVGDQILIDVANVFTHRIGNAGRLVRLGGDEFLIVHCGGDLDELIDRAATGLKHSKAPVDTPTDLSPTLSAGIASTEPGALADLKQLYREADKALYAAKQRRVAPDSATAPYPRSGRWAL